MKSLSARGKTFNMTMKIITKRKDGTLVGDEVSRQRRWQIRNPQKYKAMYEKYRQTLKYKKWHREYQKNYDKS